MPSRTEKEKANDKRYRESHGEEAKLYHKKYYKTHAKEAIKRAGEWKKNNRDRVNISNKRWREKYPYYNSNTRASYRSAWRIWFIDNGYVPFSQHVNYHHIDQKNKEFEISRIINCHPCSSEWRVIMRKEIKKCIPLSIGEHRKLHAVLRQINKEVK